MSTAAPARFTITYDDESHKYWIDGDEVPSVTTILDGTLPKEALGWWSFRIGMAAMAKLVQDGIISYPILQTVDWATVITGEPLSHQEYFRTSGAPAVRKVAKTLLEGPALDNRMHPNAIRDDAADRGTLVHDAITKMGVTDELPNLADYQPDEVPYLQALAKWWLEQEPEFLEQEVIVGSKVHGYAGRLDLICNLGGQRAMVDFKTSKAIRHSHHIQMNGYQPCYYECGGEPLERLCIVRLGKDGTYEMVDSVATDELFLAALAYHKQLKPFYARFKERHGRAA